MEELVPDGPLHHHILAVILDIGRPIVRGVLRVIASPAAVNEAWLAGFGKIIDERFAPCVLLLVLSQLEDLRHIGEPCRQRVVQRKDA